MTVRETTAHTIMSSIVVYLKITFNIYLKILQISARILQYQHLDHFMCVKNCSVTNCLMLKREELEFCDENQVFFLCLVPSKS